MSPVSSPVDSFIFAANATSTTTTSHVVASKFDTIAFVFHIDIFIFAFFGLFACLTLPRLFTRLSRGSEWAHGYFFYTATPEKARKVWKSKYVISPPLESVSHRAAFSGSDESHTFNSHTHLVRRNDEKGRKLHLPPHTQSWAGRYHKISAFLGRTCFPGYSIGRSMVVLGYFLIILYATVYKSSPFSDPQRAGFVAMSQLPIVFALATKNNILGMLLALGYEKLNWLHRAAGRILALAANMHALGYIYKWSIAGDFQKNISTQSNISGFVTLLGVDLIVIFSTSFWRRRAYGVFIVTHVTGFILVPIGLGLHKPASIPWILASVGIYVLDHILRLCNSRMTEATLYPISEMGMTRIEVPRINAGWRAGQHVRLRVLSSGMGFLGRTESHPFTIASIGGDGMTIMCKKAGNWTNSLYNMAASSDSAYAGGKRGVVRRAKIVIEGPYGGPGNAMFDSFSGAMFVAGGSGITYALVAVQDLIHKDIAGRSRVKVIELVWAVQDIAALGPMLPTFTALIQEATFTSLRISVYYTRASLTDPNKMYGYLPSSITITPGRPRFSNMLNAVVDRSCMLFTPSGVESRVADGLSGVVVSVCGPEGLGDDVRKAVGGVDPRRYKAVGGVELCEEVFGW